jgi:hypothetical protein
MILLQGAPQVSGAKAEDIYTVELVEHDLREPRARQGVSAWALHFVSHYVHCRDAKRNGEGVACPCVRPRMSMIINR